VGNVGEYNNTLVLLKHSSFAQWDKEGETIIQEFYNKYIYGPHRIVQFGENLLICASALDLFFLMDIEGNVKWEWWGHENGIGAKPDFFFKEDWTAKHVTSDLARIPTDVTAHFNSIWLNGEKFLTSALQKRRIIEIAVNKPGFEHIAFTEQGLHAPMYNDGTLVYGTNFGLMVGDKKVLPQFRWVKFVKKIKTGFAFTHERGVVFVDENWEIMEEVSLPRPFQLAFLEVSE